jgi:pimeloyl-ACP methyl ester carboxylesterase
MTAAASTEDLRVVSGDLPNGVAPEVMVESWMRQKIAAAYQDWQTEFLRLQREGGWEQHHRELRAGLLESIGGLPERTPLNVRITGVIERPGFTVEKVLFESQPGFFVTGSLYLPHADRFAPPYAGVLVPCGHAKEAKAHHEYQSMGALLALNGMVGLVFDPLDQSERMQYQNEDGSRPFYGTHMHMQEGVAAILIGQGLIRTFLWDALRALDYLESRPEVDPERLAVTGNSGGGVQTTYLFALDDRLKVASPSCYVHLLNRQIWESMGDAEQQFYGQLAIGLEHPSFYLMRAPAPVKILASTHDFFPIDAVWEGFRTIKRHYTDLGFSERADILENNADHNYDRTQREAAIRWINQWLNGVVSVIEEPDLDLFSEEDLWATPTGQVLDLDGARSIFDLFREKLETVRPGRDRAWAEQTEGGKREVVRSSVGVRSIDDIPAATLLELGRIDRGDTTITKRLLETEEGLYLPVLDLRPAKPSDEPPLVAVGLDGAAHAVEPGSELEALARAGRRVIAVDIRGTGETRQIKQVNQGAFFGTDQADFFASYILGESYLGMRIEDILRAVHYAIESSGKTSGSVELFAEGQIGVAALHAAFLEPELIGPTVLRSSLESWEDILIRGRSYHQLANAVQGALLVYDLPFLEKELGDRLTSEIPVSSLGIVEYPEGVPVPEEFRDPVNPGLVGIHFGNPKFLNPQEEYPIQRLSLHYDNAVEKRGNDWSGVWRGFLVGPADGLVTLKGESDQAIALSVAGKELIELAEFSGSATATVQMKSGELYPIEVRFSLPTGGVGSFEISWSWEDGPFEIIERSSLKHSMAQEAETRKSFR